MGSPGYGSGAGRFIGAKTIGVQSHRHSRAAQRPGVYPGNKPKDAVLVVDEAYVHFAGPENMSTDYIPSGTSFFMMEVKGMTGQQSRSAAFGRSGRKWFA
jgi:hypothetical protein